MKLSIKQNEDYRKSRKREMGRKKLVIRRLESKKQRQAKFSKRKKGILKKAKELSILCDVDLALLMFSPTGKPYLFTTENRDLSAILERLSKATVEEQEQRRAYTMKMLKKMNGSGSHTEADSDIFPADGHTNASVFLENNALSRTVELDELKEKLNEKSKILRDWQNPWNIQDLAQIRIMEQHLVASINRIKHVKTHILQEMIYHGERRL